MQTTKLTICTIQRAQNTDLVPSSRSQLWCLRMIDENIPLGINPYAELIWLLFPAPESSCPCLLGLELAVVLRVAHLKASWLVKKNHLLLFYEDKVHPECKAKTGNQYIFWRFTVLKGAWSSLQLSVGYQWNHNLQLTGNFIINLWAVQWPSENCQIEK